MTGLSANKRFRLVCFTVFVLCFLTFSTEIEAQKRRSSKSNPARKRPAPAVAVVIDERLAVLRFEPSLSAVTLQRMRSGRTMTISESREADGVTFYRVQLPPEKSGWVQSEAVVTIVRRGDDERLARLIRASKGFEQIERAALFLETFQTSAYRPAVLLLIGDLLEESAAKLTREASRKFNESEMQASGAPIHSFYQNYVGLDRYRKLGVNFVFSKQQKQFHYDGASWREVVQKHSKSAESGEAGKRLATLAEKMR